MSSEWVIPDPSLPVRQGDLLISRDPQKNCIHEICLVITADCDINKGKFGRQLACLRVISFTEYLRTTWARKRLQKAFDNATNTVRSQLAKWHTNNTGVPSALSGEATISWIRRADPEVICRELSVPEPEGKKLKAHLTKFRVALSVFFDSDTRDSFAKLVAFRSAIEEKNCKSDVVKQAQTDAKSGLPDDVFLFTSLPQLDVESAVVLLREIVAVPYEAIRYRTTDAIGDDVYLRVGRLEPVFKYSISQAFGNLYSRIGLPSDYEHRRDDLFEKINGFPWE